MPVTLSTLHLHPGDSIRLTCGDIEWTDKKRAEWKEALIRAFGPEWKEAAERLGIRWL